MRKIFAIGCLLAAIGGAAGAQNVKEQDEVALRKELDILKPLAGKTWICETTDPSGRQTLHMLRRYEPMHDGKIIKIYQECKELKSQTDGYYYYDPDKKEIAYLTLTNNGNITVGNAKEEGGKILLYGWVIFSDKKLEFRNTYELTSKGEVVDQYYRFENGEWLAGHSRVWTGQAEFPKLTGPYLGQTLPGKTPEAFAANISELQKLHGMVTFSPDGKEAFWKPFWRPVEPIMFSKLENSQWTKPKTAAFSAASQGDDSPFLSPDGKKLFFISQRPPSGGKQASKKERIWITERTSEGWSEPRPLPDVVNSMEGIHWQFSVDNQGHLYFGGEGNGRAGDIFCAKFEGGKYAVPQKLGAEINKAGEYNYSPYVFPDGNTLLFARNQSPGRIFASFRKKDGSWTEAENLERFLSEKSCLNPRVTPDGKYLFFYRASDGMTCWVDASFIEELRKKESLEN